MGELEQNGGVDSPDVERDEGGVMSGVGRQRRWRGTVTRGTDGRRALLRRV